VLVSYSSSFEALDSSDTELLYLINIENMFTQDGHADKRTGRSKSFLIIKLKVPRNRPEGPEGGEV
jgi:hypothetical protein